MQTELDIKSTILLKQAEHLIELTESRIVDKIEVEDTLILVRSAEPISVMMTLGKDAQLIIDIYHALFPFLLIFSI